MDRVELGGREGADGAVVRRWAPPGVLLKPVRWGLSGYVLTYQWRGWILRAGAAA